MSKLVNEKSSDELIDTLVDTFANKMKGHSLSTVSQWGEEDSDLSNIKHMSKLDIEETRQHLVSAYRCLSSDITFDFKKIVDPHDQDKDDYIYLVYNKKDYDRPIFSIKVPIPAEIKAMALSIKHEHARSR